MSEYKHSISVQASPDQVFAFVSQVENLPKYLPTVHNAAPQQGERVRVEGEANGHAYTDDGFYRVNQAQRRMEWGSDGENNYSGWLEVSSNGNGSNITVNLSFEPRGQLDQQLEQQAGNRDQAIREGIAASLQSIQNIVEGEGGKVPSRADS